MKHVYMRERLFSKVLVCLLIVTFGVHGSLLSTVHSAEWSASEKALSFLIDVVRLDMTKYKATLASNGVEYPSDLGGLAMEIVRYTLESNENKIDVTYKFINKTLAYCNIYVLKGSPLYAQPSTTVLDAAKSILQRYRTYAGDLNLQAMRDMLDTVTELKPMTKTVGNVKLIVSGGGDSARFEWIYTSNGLDFTRKRRSVHFEHGSLIAFSDLWGLYKIGSDSINVSEEEAISIARNATKDMPKLYGRVGNETIVLQPIVAEEPVETELMVGIREPLTLRPLWHVQLYFDKLYGNYYGVAVDIWADTGEISGTPYGTGIMGGIPPEDSTEATTPPTETPSEPQIVIPTEPPTEENPTVTPTEPPPEDSTLPPTEPLTVPPPEDSPDQTGLDLTPLLIAVPIVLVIIFSVVFHRRKKNESLEPPT